MAGIAGLWGAGLMLVLQVHQLPVGNSHAICGPWGCGPPLPALISYHGFWLVLLSLPTALCCRFLRTRPLLLVGGTAVLVGLVGIAGVIYWESTHWLPHVQTIQKDYFPQRCLFSVAILVDVPLVQVLLAGTALLVTVPLRSMALPGRDVSSQAQPENGGRVMG